VSGRPATGGRLDGRAAIVTGAASGIGAACARRLAEEGARVLLTDVNEADGQRVTDDIREAGGVAQFASQDVRDEARWEAVVERAEADLGGLHILVNNAGIGIGVRITDMTLADWQRQQAINLDGVLLGIKHAIPAMCRAGRGSIINLSSVAGIEGAPRLAAYSATKGGVRLLSKAVAKECTAEGWPVRVNSVHPGMIDTPIWRTSDLAGWMPGANELDLQRMVEASPVSRAGQTLDIANGVLYLASDESDYVTGAELVIDGGLSA